MSMDNNSDDIDIYSEYSDYIEEDIEEDEDISLSESETHSSDLSVNRDYEEEERKHVSIYDSSLTKYPIDIDIKNIISKRIYKIDIRDLNFTLLVASMVILAKSGNKIDYKFSMLCDEVIDTIIKTEIYNNRRARERNIDINNNIIDQLKRDLLRYCRFVLQCIE
jgi:hypothetical protein